MKAAFCALLATLLLAPPALAAPQYRLAETLKLGGGVKWDYLSFGPLTHHLYISQGTELTVVDPARGKVVGHVTGLDGSHGIAIDPATGLGYADSAKNRTISIFNVRSLRVIRKIPTLPDADGMAYDPASDQVFNVGGDAQAVLAIDAATGQKEALIALGGAPEFLVADGKGALFININDKSQLVKIDTKTDRIIARWNLPGCERPTGLAIDPATQRLFSSCENAKMAVINADDGDIIALLPIGEGTDAARFDAKTRIAFSSNRDGTLSMIQEIDADHFAALPPLHTELGARTMEIDPQNGALFLVTADVLSVGKPRPGRDFPTYVFKPGTLHLLIYRPQPHN